MNDSIPVTRPLANPRRTKLTELLAQQARHEALLESGRHEEQRAEG